jgi:hypothetical protein
MATRKSAAWPAASTPAGRRGSRCAHQTQQPPHRVKRTGQFVSEGYDAEGRRRAEDPGTTKRVDRHDLAAAPCAGNCSESDRSCELCDVDGARPARRSRMQSQTERRDQTLPALAPAPRRRLQSRAAALAPPSFV